MLIGRNDVIRMIALACVLLAGCGPRSAYPPSGVARDLPAAGRDWVERYGRRNAVERMDAALGRRDQAHGEFERRLGEACADKSKTWPGAVASLSRAERQMTGIYLVLGFHKNHGRSPPIIREAAAQMVARGFRARVIEAPERQTASASARQIADTLASELPHVRRAILVGFSKGSADLADFWLGPARRLPAGQRRKIRLWVNCAGVLQGSQVARWLAWQDGWESAAVRSFINVKTGALFAGCDDLASIAGDPWHLPGNRLPLGTHGHLLCIDMTVLPDGPDGWPTTDPVFRLIGRGAAGDGVRVGPCDGLVESAASVLPADAGLREWIVRIRGSHAMLDGKYRNGLPVAPAYAQSGRASLFSGAQLMDDIMRVIPVDP
jgi:hypothetical protein